MLSYVLGVCNTMYVSLIRTMHEYSPMSVAPDIFLIHSIMYCLGLTL